MYIKWMDAVVELFSIIEWWFRFVLVSSHCTQFHSSRSIGAASSRTTLFRIGWTTRTIAWAPVRPSPFTFDLELICRRRFWWVEVGWQMWKTGSFGIVPYLLYLTFHTYSCSFDVDSQTAFIIMRCWEALTWYWLGHSKRRVGELCGSLLIFY